MKLIRFFTILIFLLIIISFCKKIKRPKKEKGIETSSCNVLEDNLCCCYSNQKHYYWSASREGFCFYNSVDISCKEDTLKRKSDCMFQGLYCFYDETQFYDFR